jgi:protein-disulfide isomerase
VKDGFVVPTLINLETGEDLKTILKPELTKEAYNEKHLLVGNKDAKHKLVVFSDPMCPFCRTKIPEIYKAVKANPDTFALYYYHFPLLRIHPVSDIITRAMLVMEHRGLSSDKIMELYTLKVDAREVNATKVLGEIKKQFNLDISEKEINEEKISKEIINDREMATKSMVSGTPTVYLDGKWDPSRNKYKKLITEKK